MGNLLVSLRVALSDLALPSIKELFPAPGSPTIPLSLLIDPDFLADADNSDKYCL